MHPQELSEDDKHTDIVTDLGSFQAMLHLGRGPGYHQRFEPLKKQGRKQRLNVIKP